MDKIKTVKIKELDGSISEETYTISVDAKNVDMDNGKDLQDTIGNIDVDKDGNIGEQIDNLNNSKINKIDIIASIDNSSDEKVLAASQGKVLKELIDSTKTELEEEINDKVYFVFPKFMPRQLSGDSNLIKYKDKNIVFDAHSASAWTYIKEMLDDNNVEHIDYFVLTHYHNDHVGNFKNLVENGYIDNLTSLFMPAEVSLFDSSIYNEYKLYCTEHGLTYHVPNEGEEINIDDLKITFNNCNASILESLYTGQNDCSTVALIEFKGIKAYYPGDAGSKVHDRMIDIGFLTGKIDLYKQGHHGIDVYGSPKAVDLINPTFTVQSSGINDFAKCNFTLVQETNLLLDKGTQYYPCHMQNDYIKFSSNGNSIICENGTTYDNAGMYNGTPLSLYVDINASKDYIQEGTQEHPFTEIMQAINYANMLPNVQEIIINVSAGHYGIFNPSVTNKKSQVFVSTGKDKRIIIKGDTNDNTSVKIDSLKCLNSRVELQYLTVYNDLATAIQSVDSDLSLNHVIITSSTEELVNNIGIHIRYNSKVLIANSRIENCNYGINTQSGSECILNNVSFGSNTNDGYVTSEGILHSIGTLSFDSNTDKIKFPYYKLTRQAEQIMESHTANATTVNLAKSVTNYDWIEIYYKTNDNIYGSSGRIYTPNNKTIGVFIPHSSDIFYDKKCEMTIADTTITIKKQYQTINDSNDFIKKHNTGDYFDVVKVIGGYADYVDLA